MATATEPSRPGDGAREASIFAPRGVLGFLSDLLGKIVQGIKRMAVPFVLATGCQSTASEPPPRPEPAAEPAPNVSVAEEPTPAPDPGPRQIGKFNITFYYIVGEEEIIARANRKLPPANENQAPPPDSQADGEGSAGSGTELAAVTPPETVTLYGPDPACEPITETTREFVSELKLQGSGRLRDGRFVAWWGQCNCPTSPCFRVTKQHQWGTGAAGRPLQPFRSVGVDPKLIKFGSLLYVPELEGRTVPGRAPWGGYVHDGCVIADDTGGAIRRYHLDLFVGRKGWFLGMSRSPGRHSWAYQVPVYDGSKICERKGRTISRKAGAI